MIVQRQDGPVYVHPTRAATSGWQLRREARDAELVLEAAAASGRAFVVVSTIDPLETRWGWAE